MLDILTHHYLRVEKPYDESIMITITDQYKHGLYNIHYRDVMWTGLSDNTFAFNDQTIQTKTFTATFGYNFMDFDYLIDDVDIITGN